MLKRMVNALRGSVRLEVSGAFPERFLNLCAQRGIVFWNVERLEATRLRLTVTRQGSGPARALGDKVLCTVVPAEQSGVPFFLGRLRRRYALLVGLALSLTAVCVLSQFVLTIEVEGNEAVSTAEILTELRRQGLRPGVYGPGLDEGTISSAALLGLPELAWMSVNLHGTRAEVLVREAVPAPEVDDEEQVGSIVARSSGIVTHIEPLSGEALVAQGDTVLAGEVLISGAVTLDAPQYSELENLGQILVRAQGQVFARTWHTMTASIPLEAQVKSYTGEKASRWTLSILGHRIDFFGKSGISFPGYDKITDTWALTLPGGREMPLALSRETCRAYTLAAAPVDADAAERLLEENAALKSRILTMEERQFADLAQRYTGAGDVVVFEPGLSPDSLRRLCGAVQTACGGRCACFSGEDGSGYQYAIGQPGGNLRPLVQALNQALQGRGGGKPDFVQGSLAAKQEEIQAFFRQYTE